MEIEDHIYRINELSLLFLEEKSALQRAYFCFRRLVRALFFKPRFNSKSIDGLNASVNDVVLVRTEDGRKDLKKDFDALCDQVAAESLVIDSYAPSISGILRLPKALKSCKAHWRNHSWEDRLICTLSFLEYFCLARSSYGQHTCKVHVFCNELQYWQGLFALVLNNSGSRTVGLQHGFYRDTGSKPTKNNTNPINYTNLVCEIHISWGSVAKSIINKYWTGKVIAVGKPYVASPKTPRVSTEERYVLLLDSVQQRQSNQDLIDVFLLKDLGDSHIVKHPDDDGCYLGRSVVLGSSSEVFEGDVIIGRNSSILLQFGFSGMEIWLGSDSDFLEFIPKEHQTPIGSDGGLVAISSSFDWSDFIASTGQNFATELRLILDHLSV